MTQVLDQQPGQYWDRGQEPRQKPHLNKAKKVKLEKWVPGVNEHPEVKDKAISKLVFRDRVIEIEIMERS